MLSTDALTLITFNWLNVGGTSGSLNDIVKPSIAGTAYNHGENEDYTPGWEAYAPQILVRQGSSYLPLYYADDMWSDSLCTEANNYDPDGDGIAGIAGWGTAEGVYDDSTVANLGGGAWIKSFDNCQFTLAGSVDDENSEIGGELETLTLAGANLPVQFTVNSPKVSWTLTAGTAYNHGENEDYTPGWEATAPQLLVRQGSSYLPLYYADDMWSDSLCTEANNYDPDGDGIAGIAGWGTAEGVYDADTTVAIGGGFWMQHPGTNLEGKHTMYISVSK